MAKIKLATLVLLFLIISAASNYFFYLYGFVYAREGTVTDVLYHYDAQLEDCVEEESIKCMQDVSYSIKIRMCQMSSDLLDINIGIDDQTKKLLTELRDKIPMNCLDTNEL